MYKPEAQACRVCVNREVTSGPVVNQGKSIQSWVESHKGFWAEERRSESVLIAESFGGGRWWQFRGKMVRSPESDEMFSLVTFV